MEFDVLENAERFMRVEFLKCSLHIFRLNVPNSYIRDNESTTHITFSKILKSDNKQ